jgi:hypothetical protein
MHADSKPSHEDADPKARIFISYSRKDMVFVDRLEAALKRLRAADRPHGKLRLRGLVEARRGADRRRRHDRIRSVTRCANLGYCAQGVAYATSLNKRFAPVVCRTVDDRVVPETLRRLNFIFCDEPTRFEASIDRLAEALRTDIGWIRKHTVLGEAARRWSLAGHSGGLVLRSPAWRRPALDRFAPAGRAARD